MDKNLIAITEELRTKHGCHTVILYGSRARGDANEISDYDILGVRESGSTFRDARLWNGIYLDIFVHPESELLNPHDGMLDMRHGKILFQQDDFGHRFFERLEKIYQRGPKKLRADEIQALLTWHEKALARIGAGGIQGNLRRAELVPALMEHFFTTRGEWYRGPKASFQWLRENHPDLYNLFDGALEPNASVAVIEKLVRAVNAEIEKGAKPAEQSTNQKASPRKAPVLQTKHLTLRGAEPEDIPAILRYLKENEERFAPTDPPKSEGFYTEEFWQERLEKSRKAWEAEQSLALSLFEHGSSELVGMVTFSQMSRGPFQACYLGYALDGKYEGKGFMAEALEAAIQYVFGELNFHRIMASHLVENERSANVLRRLGFVVEGQAKDYLFINGQWRDHVLNALTNPRWKQ